MPAPRHRNSKSVGIERHGVERRPCVVLVTLAVGQHKTVGHAVELVVHAEFRHDVTPVRGVEVAIHGHSDFRKKQIPIRLVADEIGDVRRQSDMSGDRHADRFHDVAGIVAHASNGDGRASRDGLGEGHRHHTVAVMCFSRHRHVPLCGKRNTGKAGDGNRFIEHEIHLLAVQ